MAIALVVLGGGCQFTIAGVDVDAAANDAGAPPPAPAPDLAARAVADMAVADLAIAPAIVADLAQPIVPDLGPAQDLLPSPCTQVSESFTTDPSPRWTMQGTANYDAPNHRLQVTGPDFDVAGSAFYNHPLVATGFDARFTFRINDGSGADGLAFVLARAASTAGLAPFGNGQPNSGFGLGYYGMDGLAVELDTFQNPGTGDPDNNHVALMRTSDGTHLLTGTPPSPPLHSSAARTAHIRFTGTHVTVEIDNVKTIDADVPASANFNPGPYFFGFTGASGGATDRHTISSFDLVVGPPGLCF